MNNMDILLFLKFTENIVSRTYPISEEGLFVCGCFGERINFFISFFFGQNTFLKRQIMLNVGKNVEELELSHTAGRNVKWNNCFEKGTSPKGALNSQGHMTYKHIVFHIHKLRMVTEELIYQTILMDLFCAIIIPSEFNKYFN